MTVSLHRADALHRSIVPQRLVRPPRARIFGPTRLTTKLRSSVKFRDLDGTKLQVWDYVPAACMCLPGALFAAPSNLEGYQTPGFSMHKHAGKVPTSAQDDHASDGYYVFVSLICAVLATICMILLAVGIELLA